MIITDALRTWILDQAKSGFTPEQALAGMLASGWDEATAIRALEDTLQRELSLRSGQVPPREVPVAARVPEPDLSGSPTWLTAGDREVSVQLVMQSPRVVLFGNFLSSEECDELAQMAAKRLARSETVVADTGGSEVNVARTSEGMFFERGENALCTRIEARIAQLLHWPVSHGEGLQVLRYRPGAEYKPHYDYFDPAVPGAKAVLSRGGQRVGTVVMYLNTPEGGGATTFPDVGLEVAPVKGNAVFFSYDRADPSTRTLHGGAPVLAGEKWVATKWLREGEFR